MNHRELALNVQHTFLNYFQSRNYFVDKPQGLVVHGDDTLLFTNDTVSTWKNHLTKQSVPDSGLVLVQPCVRLHGLKDTICPENALETTSERFPGYFTAMGVLASPSQREQIQEDILELLREQYKLRQDDIYIFAREDMGFVDLLRGRTQFTEDPNEDIYYEWEYGIPRVRGLGATIMLRQIEAKPLEVGQIIEVRHEGEVAGYEFGFGTESFTSRLLKYRGFETYGITKYVKPVRRRFKTLIDIYSCMAAVDVAKREGFSPRHDDEYHKLIRKVADIQHTFDIKTHWTMQVLQGFMNEEFGIGPSDDLGSLIQRAEAEKFAAENGLIY